MFSPSPQTKGNLQSNLTTRFLIIWLGQFISIIGSALTSFALGIQVYQSTRSVTRFALISICFTLPAILILPIAGVLVDRANRRSVMVLSDLAAGMSTLALAILLFTGHLGLWQICVLISIESLAEAFRIPSYTAMISQLVPLRHLGRIAGIMQLGPAAAQVMAPALAAVLMSEIRLEGVLFVDFLTFVFAVATLLAVDVPLLSGGRAKTYSVFKDAAEGWKFITARPGLIALLLLFFAINLTYSFTETLVPPIVLAFTNAKKLGAILSVGALGYVAGSALMSIWGGPQRRVHGLLGSACIYAFGIVLAALKPSTASITVATFIIFFHVPIMNTCSQAIWLIKTPARMQGRVFSTRTMFAWSSIPLAFFLAGPLADYLFEPLLRSQGRLAHTWIRWIGVGPGRGTALLLMLNGALAFLLVVACYFNRSLLNIEKALPDALQSPRTCTEFSPYSKDVGTVSPNQAL